MKPAAAQRPSLRVERLESRDTPAITFASFSGGTVSVLCNAANDVVDISRVNDHLYIKDLTNSNKWSFDATKVTRVFLSTGAGNDWVSTSASGIPLMVLCGAGNDHVDGSDAADTIFGGAGNDSLFGHDGHDTLYGDADRDQLRGGYGNDVIRGGADDDVLTGDAGEDKLYGDTGHDQVIGGADRDWLYGGAGDDAMVAIDGALLDVVDGQAGSDTYWLDETTSFGFASHDSARYGTSDVLRGVTSFSNPAADRSLDGDAISDPWDGSFYKSFSNKPLFADGGPSTHDIDQEAIGDCWLLATAGAVAQLRPTTIRQLIADCGDGTYLVRMGERHYRIDADLATASHGSHDPTFAGLGRDGSLWMALVEKAYAFHRTGGADHRYETLASGSVTEAFLALGLTPDHMMFSPESVNPVTMANAIRDRWAAGNPAALSMVMVPDGSPLTAGHAYTVHSVTRIGRRVTGITLRNPWGEDNTDGSPFVTVTPEQLAACGFAFVWAK